MTTLHDIIRAAYPDADPLKDYTLQDDGNGPYLATWNIAGMVPAGVPIMASAMSTFATKYESLRTTAQSLFDQLHGIERFLRANPQIAAEVQAAESGALIGGSLMSKGQVQTALLLFANGSAFASAEIAAGLGFSNEDAVLRQ